MPQEKIEVDPSRTLLHQILFGIPWFFSRIGLVNRNRANKAIDLAWPRSISGLARYSIHTADLVMIGWAVGVVGVSALAFAFAIFRLIKRFVIGLSAGTLSLVSQYYGSEEYTKAEFVLKQSIWMAIISGFVFAAVIIVSASELVRFLGAESEVIVLASIYLQILAIGIVFQYVSVICSRAFAGAGDTKTPMIIRSGSALLNICLNAVFIFGLGPFPRFGVAGAALGTTLAMFAAAVVFLLALIFTETVIDFKLGGKQWDTRVVRQILKIGIPAIGRKVSQTAARIPLLMILALFGTGAVAAYEVGRRLLEFARTPMWGFNFSASVLVGQSLGAGNPDIALAYIKDITYMSVGLLLPVFLAMAIFPERLGSLVVPGADSDFMELFILIYALGGMGYILDEATSGALTGAGDTRWPFYGTLFGLYVVMIPGAYFAGIVYGLGIIGVVVPLLAEFYVPAAVNMYRIYTGKWVEISKSIT